MVENFIYKNFINFIILLLFISVFLPEGFIVAKPHASFRDILIVLLVSFFMSYIFLFIAEVTGKNKFLFSTNKLFLLGCFFIVIHIMPTIIAFIKHKPYFLDGFLPISIGIGLCTSARIFDMISTKK